MNIKDLWKRMAARLFPGHKRQEYGKARALFGNEPIRLSKEDIESLRKWLDSLPADEDK